MATRLGIISAYPKEDWHARRILDAARRSAEACVLSPLDFSAEVGGRSGPDAEGAPEATRLLVRGEPHERYDAYLLPRALGDEGDHELQLEIYRTLEEEGALEVNAVSALTIAIDKWKTSWMLARAGVPTPRAAVVQREEDVPAQLARLGGVAVVKPLFGSLGIGVTLVREPDAAVACLRQHRALYLQEYVGEQGAPARDVRAFVVGERVAAAMLRRAAPGEFRTNVHLGGDVVGVRMLPRAERIAVRAARALGLSYAGVDLVEGPQGLHVIEVNGTPLFAGILDATGLDMAEPIVEHALSLVRARRRGQPPGQGHGTGQGQGTGRTTWRRRAARGT